MVRMKFNYQRTMLIITEQFPNMAKTYSRWFWKEHNCNFCAVAGLPEKQIFLHLPEISKAQTVVLCQTMDFISVNFT